MSKLTVIDNDESILVCPLNNAKAKARATRRAKRKAKQSKDKPKEGTSDTSSMKCFFCKGKGNAQKELRQFLGLAC